MDLRSRSPWRAGCRDGEPKTYTKGWKQMQRKCCWLHYSQTDVQVEKNLWTGARAEFGWVRRVKGAAPHTVCPSSSKSSRSFWSSLIPWVQTQQLIGVLFCCAGLGCGRVNFLQSSWDGAVLVMPSVESWGGKKQRDWEWCVSVVDVGQNAFILKKRVSWVLLFQEPHQASL